MYIPTARCCPPTITPFLRNMRILLETMAMHGGSSLKNLHPSMAPFCLQPTASSRQEARRSKAESLQRVPPVIPAVVTLNQTRTAKRIFLKLSHLPKLFPHPMKLRPAALSADLLIIRYLLWQTKSSMPSNPVQSKSSLLWPAATGA